MPQILRRRWWLLAVLLVFWTAATAIYLAWFVVVPEGSSRSFESAKFILLSVSGFGVVASLLLTSFNAIEATANVQERIAFDRTENSFAYMDRWESPSLKEARDWTRQLKAEKNELSADALCRRIDGTPGQTSDEARRQENLKRSVITMFNFWEEIEMSIGHKRVEETSLRDAFREVYDDLYERFKPWIVKTLGSDQRAALQRLHRRWQQ